jgi:hypothetical protein
MTLQQFLEKYDLPNTIILLEGKRDVLPDDQPKLVALGTLLVTESQHITFRSGNAAGADFYFSKGVSDINTKRLEVVTPYSGHRKKENTAYTTLSLDDLDLANEPEVVYQTKTNKKMERLIDQFVEGNRNRNSLKAAYLLRDTLKVTGAQNILPSNFAFFYDDLTNPKSGGTGHTMQICDLNNVPYLTQEVWKEWV